MANIPVPKKSKPQAKVPKVELSNSPLEQSPPGQKTQMQLKLDSALKNEYKAFCSIRGRNMNDVFAEMFELYKQNQL